MELIGGFLVCVFGLFVGAAHENAKRKERVEQAYKAMRDFAPPQIHGSRKLATDKELKKAGLI
jgi:hypothetical protein